MKTDYQKLCLDLFGTDDPAEVGEKVKDWDTMKATAKELKEVEIYVRQEDGAAYYVINGRYAGSVPMA